MKTCKQVKQHVETFGIGSGASTALVNGLATAGRGSAEFVKEGERMQPNDQLVTVGTQCMLSIALVVLHFHEPLTTKALNSVFVCLYRSFAVSRSPFSPP